RTTATLNGMAVPNGLPSTAWFAWGTRGNYDQYTSLVGLGTGMNVNRVSQEISGLTNQGVYQFRLVVSNAVGVTYGAIQLFTTGRRMVGWGANGQLGRFAAAPTNAVAIAGGGSSGLAVTAENSVAVYWPWSGGAGPSFSAVAQPVLTNVLSVSAGENFSLALLANGTVTAWGGNGNGQTN